jgi:hypothetical protein
MSGRAVCRTYSARGFLLATFFPALTDWANVSHLRRFRERRPPPFEAPGERVHGRHVLPRSCCVSAARGKSKVNFVNNI